MDNSYTSCNYEAFSTKSPPFSAQFANVDWDAVYQICQIPFLDFGAHHVRCKETLNKLRQRTCTVRSNWNTKDVLLLHDNARPHTSLSTRETIAKIWWTLLPHPAHNPHLATYGCHLFGPVKDALPGRHFADKNELKQRCRDVLRRQGR
jgi:hypothetical protein